MKRKLEWFFFRINSYFLIVLVLRVYAVLLLIDTSWVKKILNFSGSCLISSFSASFTSLYSSLYSAHGCEALIFTSPFSLSTFEAV